MNKDQTLLDAYYQDYSAQTLENILLLVLTVVIAAFVCFDLNTDDRILMIVFFLTVIALILVYQYFISRVYCNLKDDIKHKRIKTEEVTITEIKREIVLAKRNGSCIEYLCGDGYNRYKLCFKNESKNKNFVRIPLHFLKAIALSNSVGKKTVKISYYEKSRVLIMFHEEVNKKAKRIPEKATLNHLIKISIVK